MNIFTPLLVMVAAMTQTAPQEIPNYLPAKTKVAILPLVNLSLNAWPDLATRQDKKGLEFATSEFAKRGFQVIPAAEVTKALSALKLDMTDEENQNRATLYDVGTKLDADLILFGVIEGTRQPDCASPPPSTLEEPSLLGLDAARQTEASGSVRMKVWLLDVKNHKIWLTAKRVEATSKSGLFEFFAKGSDRQVDAVADALHSVLTPFFARYPDPTKPKTEPSKSSCREN